MDTSVWNSVFFMLMAAAGTLAGGFYAPLLVFAPWLWLLTLCFLLREDRGRKVLYFAGILLMAVSGWVAVHFARADADFAGTLPGLGRVFGLVSTLCTGRSRLSPADANHVAAVTGGLPYAAFTIFCLAGMFLCLALQALRYLQRRGRRILPAARLHVLEKIPFHNWISAIPAAYAPGALCALFFLPVAVALGGWDQPLLTARLYRLLFVLAVAGMLCALLLTVMTLLSPESQLSRESRDDELEQPEIRGYEPDYPERYNHEAQQPEPHGYEPDFPEHYDRETEQPESRGYEPDQAEHYDHESDHPGTRDYESEEEPEHGHEPELHDYASGEEPEPVYEPDQAEHYDHEPDHPEPQDYEPEEEPEYEYEPEPHDYASGEEPEPGFEPEEEPDHGYEPESHDYAPDEEPEPDYEPDQAENYDQERDHPEPQEYEPKEEPDHEYEEPEGISVQEYDPDDMMTVHMEGTANVLQGWMAKVYRARAALREEAVRDRERNWTEREYLSTLEAGPELLDAVSVSEGAKEVHAVKRGFTERLGDIAEVIKINDEYLGDLEEETEPDEHSEEPAVGFLDDETGELPGTGSAQPAWLDDDLTGELPHVGQDGREYRQDRDDYDERQTERDDYDDERTDRRGYGNTQTDRRGYEKEQTPRRRQSQREWVMEEDSFEDYGLKIEDLKNPRLSYEDRQRILAELPMEYTAPLDLTIDIDLTEDEQ